MANDEVGPIGSIVGIDIGVTCTGVAICAYSEGETHGPYVIQKWPGLGEKGRENKVPTKVAYKAGKVNYHSWGFNCPEIDQLAPAMAVIPMFKFHLKEFHHNQGPKGFELEDVKLWYKDFLRALYLHITQYLRELWNVDVDLTTVEYHFSIPTSWRHNNPLVRTFRDLVDNAGFGNGHVTMNLTEAEASAVATAKLLKHKFQKDEAFIVCDAGGATTDICALQVTKIDGDAVHLSLLDEPKELHVGSLNIDDLFEEKAQKRIKELQGKYPKLPETLPNLITRKDFQDVKTEWGTALSKALSVTKFDIPETDEQIELLPSELESMFDTQIEKICEFVDHQIGYLKEDRPKVKLAALILAGGLGSSEYLQKKMKEYYKDIDVLHAPEQTDLRVPKLIFAIDANTFRSPLSVCKGLVYDRLQHFSDHASVISIRSTSASYGILCSEPYSWRYTPTGQRIVKDQIDGIRYVDNQIDWIIIKGQNPPHEVSVRRRYSRVVSFENPPKEWSFAIVRSRMEYEELPLFLIGGRGPRVLCHVISDGEIESNRVLRVHRRLSGLARKHKFFRIDYELLATVGLGKVKFQLKIAGEPDSSCETLKVVWHQDDEFILDKGKDRCELIKME